MRTFTKQLKEAAKSDYKKFYNHEIEDKYYYIKKWEAFKAVAETKAQKDICDFMFKIINL